MVGWIMTQDAHVLITETYEYDLHGKRDFVNVIKLRILEMGDYPSLSGWAQCNVMSYKREAEGDIITEDYKCEDWNRILHC